MAPRKKVAVGTSEPTNPVIDSIAGFVATEQPTAEKMIFMSSGLSLLNLALTDKIDCGFPVGTMANIIGGSSSGKTALALTGLAEACYNPDFDGYDLIYDDAEEALAFDLRAMFGSRLPNRMQAPMYRQDGSPVYSHTVEEFYANIMFRLRGDKPFIYILDSVDSLTDAKELDAAVTMSEDQQKQVESGQTDAAVASSVEQKGSYKMGKAKLLSEILRVTVGGLAQKKSILILISQVRDNVGSMYPGQLTRSGGKALKFYATHEIWLKQIKAITKGVGGNTYKIGDMSLFDVTKNKINGKARKVQGSIYYDYGVDDIGSMIDYLTDMGFATKVGQKYTVAPADGTVWEGTREKIIRTIEDTEGGVGLLKSFTERKWREVEEKLKLNRKSRFE